MDPNSESCSNPGCGCHSQKRAESWDRRQFLKIVGLGTGVLASHAWQAMAGPFSRGDFDRLVPADKKLRPEWVDSLRARGERSLYRGEDLKKIGMPIGGLCAGQVYLGGDGKLWHWDIFNQRISTGAEHYAKPLAPSAPFEQGFGIRIARHGTKEFRPLDSAHWRVVSFIGEYPIGYVEYRDADMPVHVRLEAFSPFIPLNTEDSSLPATLFQFTVRNESATKLELEICGWLENPICLFSSQRRAGQRLNRLTRNRGLLLLECSALDSPADPVQSRPDIVFDDFESPTYQGWTVDGAAFGGGPIEMSKIPAYQGDVGGHGSRVVNSHGSAPGETVEQRDAATGTLTSRSFEIARDYINFLIGGGAHPGKTCMNLVIDGKVVASSTGQNDNHMSA